VLLLDEIAYGFVADGTVVSDEAALQQRMGGIDSEGLCLGVPKMLHEAAEVV
jgi:hypothetical protein